MNQIEEDAALLLSLLPTADKKLITSTVRDGILGEIDGVTLTDLAAWVQDMCEQHGGKAWVDVEYGYGADSTRVRLCTDRLETDGEWMKRKSRELAARRRQEDAERATLAALQGKYGIAPQPT